MKGLCMNPFEKLQFISTFKTKKTTLGLDENNIRKFLTIDPKLGTCISRAYLSFKDYQR